MGKFDTIRRSQLIVPFGIGAMIELPDETLMTAGLDHWPSESSSHPIVKEAVLNDTLIRDERLEKRLTKLLFSDKDKKINFFLAPTEGKQINNSSSWKDKNQDMRFVRFPSWLHCKRCGILKKFDLDEKAPPRCENEYRDRPGKSKTCKDLKKFQKPIMKPVRFLIACKSGHIDDFPWKEWVHESSDPDCDADSGELFFSSSGGGTGLSGVFVSCYFL